jgi:hypothetical protein
MTKSSKSMKIISFMISVVLLAGMFVVFNVNEGLIFTNTANADELPIAESGSNEGMLEFGEKIDIAEAGSNHLQLVANGRYLMRTSGDWGIPASPLLS